MTKPWENEPDFLDGEHAGLKTALRRGPVGAWCGYVGVPKGHPLFEVGYSSRIKSPPKELIERKIDIDKIGAINLLYAMSMDITKACPLTLLLDVHGGLTYARNHFPKREPDGLWWFGFDCAHAGDLVPSEHCINHPSDVYRDIEYAKKECESLAEQLAKVENFAGAIIDEEA